MLRLLRKLFVPSSRTGVNVNRKFSIEVLKAGINCALSDTAHAKITRYSLKCFGRDDWNSIKAALMLWEKEGQLLIIKDPELASDDEECVEMLKYFDKDSPIPGFLNYQGD